eukprot:COSAG05_NODE_363_length_10783_cov_2433.390865_1_plen_163_part_00
MVLRPARLEVGHYDTEITRLTPNTHTIACTQPYDDHACYLLSIARILVPVTNRLDSCDCLDQPSAPHSTLFFQSDQWPGTLILEGQTKGRHTPHWDGMGVLVHVARYCREVRVDCQTPVNARLGLGNPVARAHRIAPPPRPPPNIPARLARRGGGWANQAGK